MIQILIFVHVFQKRQRKFGVLIVDVFYRKQRLGPIREILYVIFSSVIPTLYDLY